MFERYTEKARRVLFFARYEASVSGTPSIDGRHLLLGLMREDPKVVKLLLKSPNPLAAIRKEIELGFHPAQRISTSMDLPFGEEAKLALHFAAEESQQLKHRSIAGGHLLLGLLRAGGSAAEILHRHGVELEESRKQIALLADGSPTDPPLDPAVPAAAPSATEFSREDLQRLVDQLPQSTLNTVGRLLELLTGKA
jgi:ATP-dependent Clp protease ATP-binding subunit ClpC